MPTRRSLETSLFVVALLMVVAAPAAAQSEAELNRARETFREGVELTQRGEWAPAAERFREVREVRDTAAVRYNLGLALVHSGESEEGTALLRSVVDDESLDQQSRRSAREEIALSEGGGRSRRASGGQAPDDGEPEDGAEDSGDEEGNSDAPTGERPFQLELHAGFSGFGFGLATGARFGIPLVHGGFLPSAEDALYLTAGLDFYYVQRFRGLGGGHSYGGALGIPVTLQWQLYLSAEWTVSLELGAQFFMHPRFFDRGDFDVYEPGYFVVAAASASYRFAEIFHLSVRLGTPMMTVGLTIDL